MISSTNQTANVPAPAPASTNIGAFFDIDGTLLPAPSLEWRFARYLLARRKIRGTNIIRWLTHNAAMLLSAPRASLEANKCYLAHLRETLIADWESSLAAPAPATDSLPLFAEGIERIFWHLTQGHRVFLISGTLASLARVIAKRFRGAVDVCATELEVRDGCWTGRLAGEHMTGAAKTHSIRGLALKFDLSLASSYAYGNDVPDGPMLDAVGYPVAVNPSKCLACIAREQRWKVRHWSRVQTAHDKSGVRLIAACRSR